MQEVPVHLFWAYGQLSALELMACRSFALQGYRTILWTYGDIIEPRALAEVRDAREILPESRVFKYRNGSYAGFSNLFRYAVLSRLGGLWADTDVICLCPPSELGKEPFLVSERSMDDGRIVVNVNLIFNPAPKTGDIIDLALAFAERFPLDRLRWGDCGPRLLTMIARTYPRLAFRVRAPDFANPIPYTQCPDRLLEPDASLPASTRFLHCYNEMWRRKGRSKDAPFPAGSIMAGLAERFL